MDLIDVMRSFVAANDRGSLADSDVRKRVEGALLDAIFDGLVESFNERIASETDERFDEVWKRIEKIDPQPQE